MGAQATLGDENPFSVEGRRLCVRPEVHVEQGKSCTGMSVDIGLQVLRPTTSAYPARKSGGPTNGNDHDGGGEDGSTRPGSGRVDSTDRAVFPDSGEMDYEGSGRDGVSRSKFDWLQRLLEKEDWFDFTLRETCGIGICRHQSRPRVRASNSSTQVPTDDVVLHTAGNLDNNEANPTTSEFVTDDLKNSIKWEVTDWELLAPALFPM